MMTQLAEVLRAMANYGSEKKYYNVYKGINSRLDEVQAAVLSVKLAHLDEENSQRRAIAERYLQEIDNPYIVLPDGDYDENHVWHLFVIRTVKQRRACGIFTRERGAYTSALSCSYTSSIGLSGVCFSEFSYYRKDM